MRLGLHALGIGAGADRAVIDAVASAADGCGFASCTDEDGDVVPIRRTTREARWRTFVQPS